MANTDFNNDYLETTEDTEEGLQVMLLLMVLLEQFMSGAGMYLVRWINSIQMIIHLPMVYILLPPNVS